MFSPRLLTVLLLAWTACYGMASTVLAQPTSPLTDRIDALLEQAAQRTGQPLSGPAGDAEFLRRVTLDLTGTIPTADEVRGFLDDPAADKRARRIERLLNSPQHARRMQYVFDTMLMQRLPAKHVKRAPWREYLYRAFRENRTWDRLAEELLSADGADPAQRPAARFLLDRELKIDPTTRDIGRLFLGRDMQCAQCHDHPHLDDYLQRHYFGISAFLTRSYVFTDPKTKLVSLGEKATGTVKFSSVFTGEESETTPRILDLPPLADPPAEKDAYVAKPDKKTRGVPKYSRRERLAAAVTDPDNRAFRLNIANRVWAVLMGRGIVEPVDMFHANSPNAHPELLNLLADDLHDHCYDLQRMIRAIALSRAYQRTSRYAGDREPDPAAHVVAGLKPLGPEQLAWATMEALGVVDAARDKVRASVAKKHPKSAGPLRAEQIERATAAAVEKHVDAFVAIFASGNESSRFDATANQALFMKNGELLTQWLKPTGNNLVARLARIEDSGQLADELYLAILSRRPAPTEVTAVADLLAGFGDDRATGLSQLARSLLCSAEFRFNH